MIHVQEGTESTNLLNVLEGTERINSFEEGEVNGQPVKRIQLDSGASRTVVNRSLISPTNIGEETIVITFGNGASDKYSLAPIRVKIEEEEYCVKATIVQDLAEVVLLGRDVPLHKYMVKCLPRGKQMELLHQLGRDNNVQLEERPEDDERALAVVSHAPERRMAQQ